MQNMSPAKSDMEAKKLGAKALVAKLAVHVQAHDLSLRPPLLPFQMYSSM